MECVDLATFTFGTWQIRSCLLCKFISLGTSLISFSSIFRIFSQKKWIVELFNWSEFREWKENEIFSSQAKNAWKHARITSLEGIAVNHDVAAFTFAAWQIRSCLLRQKRRLFVVVFLILRGFLTDLCDWSEFFGCLIEARQEIQRKINYLLR